MGSSIALSVLTVIFSLAATILAFIFIVPENKREKLNNFGKALHDIFNFKFLIVEKILQFCYVLATAATIIGGFFTLFSFQKTYNWYSDSYSTEWTGYWGFLIMILGPIAVRIAYEFVMMAILAVKNIIQINNKLKNQNAGEVNDVFSSGNLRSQFPGAQQPAAPAVPTASAAPAEPAAPAPTVRFCTKCGSSLNPDGSCPHCN